MASSNRIRIKGTQIDILGSFEELDNKLDKGEISQAEYDEIFAASRIHGLLGDIHPFAVGGSDTSGILGISPWNTPSQIAASKTSLAKKKAVDKNQQYLFDRGHVYESAIRRMFEINVRNDNPELSISTSVFPYQVVNENWPHCVADIDGVVMENGVPGILEIKSTDFGSGTYRSFFENEEIPEYYFCQVQFYMMVLNYSFAYIVCAKDFSKKGMKYFRVERDDEFGLNLMKTCEAFVENIRKGNRADDSIVTNEKLLKKKLEELCGIGNPLKENLRLGKELLPLFDEYDLLMEDIEGLTSSIKSISSSINAKKRSVDKIKDKLKAEIKDGTFATLKTKDALYEISFPPVSTDDWGSGAKEYLKINFPDVFEEVAKNNPKSRSLSIKKTILKGETS